MELEKIIWNWGNIIPELEKYDSEIGEVHIILELEKYHLELEKYNSGIKEIKFLNGRNVNWNWKNIIPESEKYNNGIGEK